MVESSKILTVSYGTFSCTLEGFDDSFGTMKAIAEYFRDLAQGDRYFGAEPPAPDAEMLTRIAEKEIARRVEARADESGIVLRAVEAEQAPVAAPVMPPVVTAPSEEAVAEVATPIVDDIAEEDAAPEEEVEESTATATADVVDDVAGPEAEDEDASTLVASSPATPDIAEDVADADLPDTDDMPVEEMDVTAPAATFADMDAAAITTVPAHPDANSVAAKLQRIRAVVGSGAPASSDDTVAGDLAEDVVAVEDDADYDAVAAAESIDAMADNNDFAEDVAENDIAVEDAAAAEQEEAPVAEEVSSDDDAAEVEAEAEVEEAPKQNFRARILRVAKKPAEAAATTRIIAEDTAPASKDAAVAEDSTALSVPETPAAQMDDDDVATSDDEEESIFADIDLDDEDLNTGAGSLSAEDEAELMADLAAVEDDAAETPAGDAPVEEAVADEAPVAKEAPTSRSILPEADDAAMNRIMDQTDEALSEPEGSRRRSAIAQLKAAVAATEAARQLGDKGDDAAAKENAFRDDLNEAVRPRSSSDLPRTQSRTERPRPAPLKLVASQRVGDEDGEAEAAEPTQEVADNVVAHTGNFADFAAEMGATELPDLLEAAAAFTAYVEGVEDFSRPQIMKKVQASATEEFSREDGLRSFGTLLRQGRISKVRNGRFQISEQTRFKPEKKAG